jgi:hypothetical protein
VVYLGGDGRDEGLDVELGRAALLAGRVGALEAPVGLPQGAALGQGGVLDVAKIFLQIAALEKQIK